MVRKCDMFPQLSLKTHEGMKFLRSFAAAVVVCGAASSMAAPISAQIGVPNSTNAQATILNKFSHYNKTAIVTGRSTNRSLGGSMNQVGNVIRNYPNNSAYRRQQKLQRERAAAKARMSRPYFKGIKTIDPAGISF